MSTDKPEHSGPAESDAEAMAEGYVPDSQLPEDLRPDENPLAAPPEESDDGGAQTGDDRGRDSGSDSGRDRGSDSEDDRGTDSADAEG
jgi:hypothetical protein